MPGKTDFKKDLDSYRARPGEFRIVDVPDMQYLMTDGHGDPNTSPVFAAAVLERLHHGFIPGQGLRLAGTHHEIYLSDFRKVAPEKQRTILRQPVEAVSPGAGEVRAADRP